MGKAIAQNSFSNLGGKANELSDVVYRNKGIGQQFFGVNQVAQVGAGKVLAGVAGAAAIYGGQVAAKLSIFEVPSLSLY